MDGFQAGCPPCPPGQFPEYGQGANLGMVHCVFFRSPLIPDESSSEKDPHLHFAHGGRADFRGKDRQCYNFFSAPGLSVNVRIEVATHVLPSAPGHALTVHGSFITEAHVAALVGPKRRDEPPFPPPPSAPRRPLPVASETNISEAPLGRRSSTTETGGGASSTAPAVTARAVPTSSSDREEHAAVRTSPSQCACRARPSGGQPPRSL